MNRLTKFAKSFKTPERFKDWCKHYTNKFIGDVPSWILLFGLTKEYIDIYEINIIELTLEDMKIINKLSNFKIKPNLILLNEKNVECIHYVDFNYNYNNLFTNDNSLMDWFNEIVYSDSSFDFSNMTYESINNFSVKTLVSLVVNNIFYHYDNSLNDFLYKNRKFFSIELKNAFKQEIDNHIDCGVKLLINLLIDKIEPVECSEFENSNETMIYGTFDKVKNMLNENQLRKYYSELEDTKMIESVEMLKYAIHDNQYWKLTYNIRKTIIDQKENPKLFKILMEKDNENLLINIYNKMISSFNHVWLNDIYYAIVQHKPEWNNFRIECLPEPKDLV